MPVDPPHTVYQDQLTTLSHGLALWNPTPPKTIYNNVSIGDVGYLHEGTFIRMFNVTLPWDHPSNGILGRPEPYDSLDCGPFTNTIEDHFGKVDYSSRFFTAETTACNAQAVTSDDIVTYRFRTHGALLSLPNGGHREDVIRTKAFEDYIRDHVDRWFNWAQTNKLGVKRMEDLILVSGCTLAMSWAAAAFVDNALEAEISLERRTLGNVGASFTWGNVRGRVAYHNSRFDPQNPPMLADQCVFIRGFRAKRILFWGKRIHHPAAELWPDDPDNRREDEIQVSRVPVTPKYRDPLVGVLDYIVEKCQADNVEEGLLAIAHDDDLRIFEHVETMTADAIEEFLHGKQIPLLVENGAAILTDPTWYDEPPVSDDKKAIFYAAAELNGEPVPLVIHPVLTKYYLKLEVNNSSDHDYGLPKEDMNSPAVYPPMLSLKLESHQGYPQVITVEASSDTRGVGVTVQEVLRMLHEDLWVPFPRRELHKSGAEERAGIDAAFRKRCRSEEELSKGPRRIDHLGSRDRLQILPKFGPDGGELIPMLPTPALCSAEPLDESRVAGPSSYPIR